MSNLQDPPAPDAGLFGQDYDAATTQTVIIPVPWEPTASYGRGTSQTPSRIIAPSHQLDFFDGFLAQTYGDTIAMHPIDPAWAAHNAACTALAKPIIEAGGALDEQMAADLAEVNAASHQLNTQLYSLTRDLLHAGKATGVLGGDHSAPLGHMKACLERFPGTGVLHIDAHHDLRKAYLGFTYSHASVMYNLVRETPELGILVSVGIRDYCEEEAAFAANHPKITTFYDRVMKKALFAGETWVSLCEKIVDALPQNVYISFDIDGCLPELCPHTGTPVPGGLDFDQVTHLLEQVVASGRRVVGFDLCEVAPNSSDSNDEWDLNVGARMLYRLCVVQYASNR